MNRTSVKSNITTKNVPTVTNAILSDILNADMADNLKFREDVAVTQSSNVSAITVDFTGKDRVDLTRTGGTLNITVSGIGDGETVFLLITKTAGQAVTWVGVTDITAVKYNADAASTVLYEIVRKGANYFTIAWVETVMAASSAEADALSLSNKFIAPATIPVASLTVAGIVKKASASAISTGTDGASGKGNIYYVAPSHLKAAVDTINTTLAAYGVTIGLKKNRLISSSNFSGAGGAQVAPTLITGDFSTVDFFNLTSTVNGWFALPDPASYQGNEVVIYNSGSSDKALDVTHLNITALATHLFQFGSVTLLSNGTKWLIIDWNTNTHFS